MKINSLAGIMLCALCAFSVHSQRTISSFREMSIVSGNSTVIDGEERTEPGIYYVPQSDGTFQAVRLTVAPKSEGAEITQPYLNLNAPNSICVNWKTSAKSGTSVVRYGLSPENLDGECESAVKSFTRKYYWHTAKLTGLSPNTVYYYKVVSNGKESEVYRFRTAPEAGDKSVMRVLLIGDHQRNERSDYEWLLNAARETVKEKYGDGPIEDHICFLLNDGDQVDAGGELNLYEKVHLYKSRSVSPWLPNMTAVGNHEYRGDDKLNNYRKHYSGYADLEYQGIKSGDEGYYAYQSGSVLFVVLNSDDTSVAQKMWVRKVVAAASSDETVQFIVSVQHRPLYAEQYSGDVSPWMLNEIMPVLSSTPKHVLNCAGHHHLYARGQMTDTPVYHIITGGGVGTSAEGYEQLWGKTPDNFNHDEVQKTIDHWTYQILEFDPQTRTMKVECYSIGNSRLAVDNELVDSFSRTIVSDNQPARPAIGGEEGAVTLPHTFAQTGETSGIYAVRYQVASDREFKSPLIDRLINAEDFYGATDDFRPLDINKGLDLAKFTVDNGALANGTYFIRVKNRNADLDWSEYSEPQQFTVEGASDPASVTVSGKFLRKGNIHIDYTGAPVGTEAWIAVYREHQSGGDGSFKWSYTSDVSGSVDFDIQDGGAYYAVLFKDSGYTEISPRCYFVVSDNCDDQSSPAVSTDKKVYEKGEPIDVKLTDAPCISKDWVGLYSSTVAVVKDGKSHSYAYVGTDPQGTVRLNVSGNFNYSGAVTDGVYYVTYCVADQYYEPMERSYLVVGRPVILETDSKEYEHGSKVRLVYEGAPQWDGMKILVYSGETVAATLPVTGAGGAAECSRLSGGSYEACVVTADGAEISPRVAFTVAKPVCDPWMGRIKDNAYADQLSIPGTHDAGTGNGTTMDSSARTQELSLEEQFAAGIRAFDLRPSVSGGELKIYHGIVQTKVTFDEALTTICDQLDAYPSEFAVVIVRHEDDHESASDKQLWNELMLQVLNDGKYAGRFVDFDYSLTVADLRGKILLISRDKYADKPVGAFITGWNHNSDFSAQAGGKIQGTDSRKYAVAHVQDFYETKDAMETKLGSIRALLDHSVTLHTGNVHKWVINHTSGYSQTGLIANADAYRRNAASTNTMVAEYLADESKAGPTGLVMMDFAGVDRSGDFDVNGKRLTEAVVANNFRYEMRCATSAIDDIVSDQEAGVVLTDNGCVSARGRIEVYSVSGMLMASGFDSVVITAPGIYIVRTETGACKIVIR